MKKQKPKSIKQQRVTEEVLSIAEIISRDYNNRLKMLRKTQDAVTKSFIEHPIYHEYVRRKEIDKQYKRLENDYQNSLKNLDKFYKTSRREYRKWLMRVATQPKLIEPWHHKFVNKIFIGLAGMLGYIVGTVMKYFSKSK